MQALISEGHKCNCLTACQKCLLTFSNRGFHHILDWRLGVGLLRLMIDETYDFGFNAENRDSYEELSDLDHIIEECAKRLKLEVNAQDGYYCVKNGECTVIYHPLWEREKVRKNIECNYNTLRMFNTFKVLRSDLTEDNDPNGNPTTNPLNRNRMNQRHQADDNAQPQPTTDQPQPTIDDDDVEL